MDITFDQIVTWAKDHFLLLLVVFVAIVVVIRLIKAAIKWLIVVAIIAAVVIYGGNTITEPIKQATEKVLDATALKLRDEALGNLIVSTKVTYKKGKNEGEYIISTPEGITIEGSNGSKTAKLSYKGYSFDVPVTDVLFEFISRVKDKT